MKRLRVSRRSWHFRLASVFGGRYYAPRNLCGHFWTTAFSAFFIAYAAWVTFEVGFALVRNPIIALIVGAVIVAIVAAVLAGIAVVRAVRFLRSRAAARPVSTRVREPNLLVEFVKAKKQKACPLIEVVD